MNEAAIKRVYKFVKKTRTCWLWIGAYDLNGYGVVYWKKKSNSAHRVTWEICGNYVPKGMQIDHLCRNRFCVNPNHLEVVTQRENMMRGMSYAAQNKRKTHCVNGHPFSGSNLTTNEKGHRSCKKCNVNKQHKFKNKTIK